MIQAIKGPFELYLRNSGKYPILYRRSFKDRICPGFPIE